MSNQPKKRHVVLLYWPMSVQADEHHTNNESPVRKPGISYAEVSLHRGDMMDLRYWQPLKALF